MLKAATSKGQSISSAVKLDAQMLNRVAASRQPVLSDGTRESIQPLPPMDAASYVEIGMDAVRCMDESALEKALQDALVAFTRLQVLSEVISPLLEKVGNEWSAGLLKITKEHLASGVVEGFLWNMLRSVSKTDGASRMVVAAPAGQCGHRMSIRGGRLERCLV